MDRYSVKTFRKETFQRTYTHDQVKPSRYGDGLLEERIERADDWTLIADQRNQIGLDNTAAGPMADRSQ